MVCIGVIGAMEEEVSSLINHGRCRVENDGRHDFL